MRILDRYVMQELIYPFLFSVCAFATFFVCGGTLWRISQYISQYGASGWIVAKMFFYSLPGVIILTIPMSMLLGVLLCFGRLSGSSEITAMKTGGQSFLRLAAPVLAIAFVIAILTVAFNETIVPQATAAYSALLRTELGQNAKPKSEEHVVIISNSSGDLRLTYAKKFDQPSGSMQGVTYQEYQKDKLVLIENADNAVWREDHWIMNKGVAYYLNADSEQVLNFEQQYLPVDKPPEKVLIEQKSPEELTIRELKQRIKTFDRLDNAKHVYEVELHQRLAIPMATFIFAIVGAPLGLVPHRTSSARGLGISMVIIFLYYILMSLMTTLGQSGRVPPVLAAWTPNLVGLMTGLYFMRRAHR